MEEAYATSRPQACNVITSTMPDIRLQKPAISVASEHEFEAAAFVLAAEQGVAHDQERRRQHQQRHRGEVGGSAPALSRPKLGRRLVASW